MLPLNLKNQILFVFTSTNEWIDIKEVPSGNSGGRIDNMNNKKRYGGSLFNNIHTIQYPK